MRRAPFRVGLVADTHGLVRAALFDVLAGVDAVLHAGDVAGPRGTAAEVLDELGAIAAVHAVRGNVDAIDDPRLPETRVVSCGGVGVRLVHGHDPGRPTPALLTARFAEPVIVFGHTHRALVTRVGAQLVVNPGAAGPRRFRLEPSVAILTLEQDRPPVAGIVVLPA